VQKNIKVDDARQRRVIEKAKGKKIDYKRAQGQRERCEARSFLARSRYAAAPDVEKKVRKDGELRRSQDANAVIVLVAKGWRRRKYELRKGETAGSYLSAETGESKEQARLPSRKLDGVHE